MSSGLKLKAMCPTGFLILGFTVALKYRRQSSVREEGGTLVYETVDTNPVIAKKKEKHVEVCLRQPKRRNKSDDTSPVTDFGGSMRLDTNSRR